MVSRGTMLREPRGAMKASGLGLTLVLLTSFASGRGQQPAGVTPPQAVTASKGTTIPTVPVEEFKRQTGDYTVSPDDVLDVNFLEVQELSRTYRVSSNGFLTLPLLPEPIAAEGKTLDQLSQIIATKFREAGMLNNAHVSVSLRETRQHTVLVTGEVRRPQAYPIFGPTRLLDVLVQAGGLSETAGNDAIIMRGEAGTRADMERSARTGGADLSAQRQSFTLNIRKLVDTGDDSTNIDLYPGDRVTVQRASLIYVMGAVARPGGYVLNEARNQVTVLKALAMAGDVSPLAKKKRITILRPEPGGTEEKRIEIPVNYKAILHGQVADQRLKPDDILYVPESAGLKAWHTAVSSAVSLANSAGVSGTALAIYR